MNYLKCKMNDDTIINYLIWKASEKPKGIVVLVHGMAEYIARYEEFANQLSESGFIVYGHDQRGHGKTAGSIENLGFFANENGWDLVVEDIFTITDMAKKQYPELPVFLFGHSMGSFIVRDYVSKYSDTIDGLICSGTASDSGILGKFMLNIAKIQVLVSGAKKPSKLIDKITNDTFNKKIKPLRTRADWLSRDENEVDKYVEDKFCGTVFSNKFYDDLFSAVIHINEIDTIVKIRKDLPIALFSGDCDPVGDYGIGVSKVYNNMSNADITDVSLKLYSGARHEILNEINKLEVMNDILDWLEKRV